MKQPQWGKWVNSCKTIDSKINSKWVTNLEAKIKPLSSRRISGRAVFWLEAERPKNIKPRSHKIKD